MSDMPNEDELADALLAAARDRRCRAEEIKIEIGYEAPNEGIRWSCFVCRKSGFIPDVDRQATVVTIIKAHADAQDPAPEPVAILIHFGPPTMFSGLDEFEERNAALEAVAVRAKVAHADYVKDLGRPSATMDALLDALAVLDACKAPAADPRSPEEVAADAACRVLDYLARVRDAVTNDEDREFVQKVYELISDNDPLPEDDDEDAPRKCQSCMARPCEPNRSYCTRCIDEGMCEPNPRGPFYKGAPDAGV